MILKEVKSKRSNIQSRNSPSLAQQKQKTDQRQKITSPRPVQKVETSFDSMANTKQPANIPQKRASYKRPSSSSGNKKMDRISTPQRFSINIANLPKNSKENETNESLFKRIEDQKQQFILSSQSIRIPGEQNSKNFVNENKQSIEEIQNNSFLLEKEKINLLDLPS